MLRYSPLKSSAVLALSLTQLALLSSCSPKGATNATDLQDPRAKAPARVEASLSADDSKRLRINKESLDKEFLLYGSYASQEKNATSHGLKTRVVTFHRNEASVFMLESTEGRLISDDVPTKIILAELPILSESDTQLTLDFNAGMKAVFWVGGYHASDYQGTDYEEGDTIARIASSFIDSIRAQDNTLEIRQIARIDEHNPELGADVAATYELRYYLKPYRPTRGFVARETSDFRKVGYFETSPVLERRTGQTKVRIARRDENKVFTYYLSSNTPADKIQSIKDGVLYWNKVFGHEVVRVEMAPEGVSAPDSRYNVIQWINDSSTASAYADALSDPRTGEILHSQIFLHSGLFEGKGPGLVGLIRRLNHMTDKTPPAPTPQTAKDSPLGGGKSGGLGLSAKPRTRGLRLKGLTADHLCDLDFAKAAQADIRSLVALEGTITPDMYERLSNNYVTYAVAHEVGHTLGLRHNFAGSLETQVSLAERDETIVKYLRTNEVPANLVVTSSIMEYAQLIDSAIVGAQIKAGNTVLPYDKVAIEWGYRGASIPEDAPPFCSDYDTKKFADCKRFDVGANAVSSNFERMGMLMRTLPVVAVEEFIRIKTDPKSDGQIDAVALLTTLSDTLEDQIGWLTDMAKPSLLVDRAYGELTSNLLMPQAQWVALQVQNIGGVDKVLFSHLPATDRPALSFAQAGEKEVESYLARPEVISGIGYDGNPYTLSESEIELIKARTVGLLQTIDRLVTGTLLKAYSAVPLLTLYTDEIHERLVSISEEVILKQVALTGGDATPTRAVKGKRASVKAPVADPRGFVYSNSDRLAAASLLSAKGRPLGFGEVARLKLIDAMNAIIQAELGAAPKFVDVRKLTPSQLEWFTVQREILKALEASAKTE